MTLNRPRVFALIGAVLLVILGIGRGLGGVLLLLRLDSATGARPGALATIAGAGLLLVALVAGIAAAGVIASRRFYFRLGLVAVALFVLGGVFNGYVLFGAPRAAGVIGNLAFALVTAVFLHIGQPRQYEQRSN